VFNVHAATVVPSIALRSKVFSVTSSSLVGLVTARDATVHANRPTAASDKGLMLRGAGCETGWRSTD